MCYRSVDYHLVVTDVEKGSVAAEDVSSPSPLPFITPLTSTVALLRYSDSACQCLYRQADTDVIFTSLLLQEINIVKQLLRYGERLIWDGVFL